MKKIVFIGLDSAPGEKDVRLLESYGYAVAESSYSRVLAEKVGRDGSVVLMIVDCRCSLSDWFERLWRLRKFAPDVPIVVLSDRVSVEDYVSLSSLGIHDHLTRPVDADEMLQTVRSVLETAAPMRSLSAEGEAMDLR